MQPVLLMCRSGTAHPSSQHWRWKKKEQIGLCILQKENGEEGVRKNSLVRARSLSKLQWAELAWRCGKEERRREGLIQASWEDIAQLAPVLVWREGESKEKGERLCPPGWWSGKALEGGG